MKSEGEKRAAEDRSARNGAPAAGHGGDRRTGQEEQGEVTGLLASWRRGDRGALERLMPLIYHELRRLAERCMSGERIDHTLGATALVHEAYLRMARGEAPPCRDRGHFFNLAGRVMRRLLVEHARAHLAAKRGGGAVKVTVDPDDLEPSPVGDSAEDLLALDQALDQLSHLDPRKGRTLELRFFAGLTIEETAECLQVSPATVILDSRLGRAWLLRELSGGSRAG